ncbi:MAG: hypothetical protein KC657_27865 [Myxococcales bacterium]|nr:hypothetical protein [Myxococcales bacterium]
MTAFARSFTSCIAAAALAGACATAETALSTDEATTAPPDAAPPALDAGNKPAPVAPADASDGSTCEAPCGLAPQCGCAAGQTCDVDVSGARACVTGGSLKVGVACLSTRECVAGLVCADGVCRQPCATVGATCTGDRAGTCKTYAVAPTDGGAPGVTYTACSVTCAYDKEDACGFEPNALLAAACVYQPSTGDVECAKVSRAQVQSGLCEADAQCGAGRVCVERPDFKTCRRLCKPGDPAACGGCTAFAPPRVVAGVAYGYCP